jgi:hypothetical protein
MPELVNNKVGSFPGTKLDERTMVWPLDSKNERNLLRMSDEFMASRSKRWRSIERTIIRDKHGLFCSLTAGANFAQTPLEEAFCGVDNIAFDDFMLAARLNYAILGVNLAALR